MLYYLCIFKILSYTYPTLYTDADTVNINTGGAGNQWKSMQLLQLNAGKNVTQY